MMLIGTKRLEGIMALALAVVAILALDVIAPQRAAIDVSAEPVVERAPSGGSWVCTAGIGGADNLLQPIFGDVEEDSEDTVLLSSEPQEGVLDDELFDGEDLSDDDEPISYVPEAREAEGLELVIARPDTLWDLAGTVLVREFTNGVEVKRVTFATVAAGEIRYRVTDHALASFVEVSWVGPPVTVSRVWTLSGNPIPATLAGVCQSTSAYGFVAPGFSTAEGANVRLRIANPYATSASVSVRFFTPNGVQEPAVLKNVSISPFSVYETVVNDVLPEANDVGAQIDVLAGRVAVEGSVFAAITGGATRGMSLVPVMLRERSLVGEDDDAEDALGERRFVHATAASFDTAETVSWLWFTNVSDVAARVDLVLHTPTGAAPPEGLAEISIPPRSIRRIALTDTFPTGTTIAGFSGRTDSPAVYLTLGSDLAGGDEPRGIALQAGQSPDTSWVISGPRSDRRSERLFITNISADDVSVDVWFHDGEAITEPEELQAQLIPAGTSQVVVLDPYLRAGFGYTVFVRAPEPAVVVSSLGFTSGVTDEHLVVDPGIGSERWLVRSPKVSVRQEQGLIRRLAGRSGA